MLPLVFIMLIDLFSPKSGRRSHLLPSSRVPAGHEGSKEVGIIKFCHFSYGHDGCRLASRPDSCYRYLSSSSQLFAAGVVLEIRASEVRRGRREIRALGHSHGGITSCSWLCHGQTWKSKFSQMGSSWDGILTLERPIYASLSQSVRS